MSSRRLFQSKTFLAIVIILLGFFSWFSYYRIQEMIDSSKLVNHSSMVTLKIEEVLSYTKDAETAQRGFIITRDSNFLQPLNGSKQRISSALSSLDSLVQDNKVQINNFYKYKAVILSRLDYLETTRKNLLPKTYNPDSIHTYLLQGKILMDSGRRQAAQMENVEQNLLSQRAKENQSNIFITPIITLFLSLLLLSLVIAALLILRSRYNELVKTKIELSDSDEKFQGLLEHAPDAIVIVNQEGNIQIVNLMAEKMFGFKREELIGNKVEILIPERLKSVHAKHRVGYNIEPKVREMGSDLELKGKRKDGSEFPVEISLSPVKTKNGILVAAAIRDITRRRKTEEELVQTALEVRNKNLELQRSNAQLQSFNYIASHDLQEPLRKIQVFTGKILDTANENLSEKANDYFKRIQNASARMQELVESLFNYSMLGKESLNFTKVDLNLILGEVRKHLFEEMEEKNVELNSEKLPNITADPLQMYQLFSNLIDNAIKYHKEDIDPVIAITVNQSKDYKMDQDAEPKDFWKISVRDNGIGFDEAQREKIFELFRRLHGKQDYPGTGIGLAICKKVVENHGGFITAESSPGEGSTFQIYLPETGGE